VALLALFTLIAPAPLRNNLGNAVRNRRWLADDLNGATRAEAAGLALAHYRQSGGSADRDRGALTFLAHHPAEALRRYGGTPTDREQANTAAFMAPIAALTAPTDALTDLQTAALRYPPNRFAHLYLAEAYRAERRLEEAAREYQRAGASVEWVIAEARRRWDWGRGDVQGAQEQLAIAARLAPDATEVREALKLIGQPQ
jgi:tetratricopeptide (TPR) repeat protein